VYPKDVIERCVHQSEPWSTKARRVRLSLVPLLVPPLFELAAVRRIMFRTILPNCMAPLIVQAALSFSDAILNAAALGFLGMGAQPPTPEWGAMLNEARADMMTSPHVAIFPSLAIFLTVLAFNLLGDGLRDALDPKIDQK